jgi:hypothetical protein
MEDAAQVVGGDGVNGAVHVSESDDSGSGDDSDSDGNETDEEVAKMKRQVEDCLAQIAQRKRLIRATACRVDPVFVGKAWSVLNPSEEPKDQNASVETLCAAVDAAILPAREKSLRECSLDALVPLTQTLYQVFAEVWEVWNQRKKHRKMRTGVAVG